MTEKEAIRYLECFEEWNEDDEWLRRDIMEEFIECCTKALTEIQQYRAMNRKLCKCFGDCDGFLKAVVDGICYRISVKEPIKLRLLTNEDADMWDAYRAVGTVEECREAMEKQKPKKPNRSGMDEQDYYVCPNCGADIGSIDDYFPRDRCCHECGQAIQWSENLEGMKNVTSKM